MKQMTESWSVAGSEYDSSRDDFVKRHMGTNARQQTMMLHELGVDSLDELMASVIPADIYAPGDLDLPVAMSETEALAELRLIAGRNRLYRSFIGQGYYNAILPGVIQRNVLENPAWYTAYTPYQAEISQGRLEALFHFQTLVCELTGLEVANASLLDEATAAAEAMTLCRRAGRNKGNVFFVDLDVFPQTLAVLRTRARHMGIELHVGNAQTQIPSDCFGVLLQYPGASGEVRCYDTVIGRLRTAGILTVVATDLLGLLLLRSPGEMGADIAVGSAQRFGVPLGCGGPHAAFMAARERFVRNLPGRIIGRSVDRRGHDAYRMALQTREQHIRREKATSNICTSQTLLAVIAVFYAIYHGPEGLRAIAGRVHRLTSVLAQGLAQLGFERTNTHFFDTLTVVTGRHTQSIVANADKFKINLRRIDSRHLGVSLDETAGAADVEALWRIFSAAADMRFAQVTPRVDAVLSADFRRQGEVLGQEVFSRYHSETEMLRYICSLADKDIALNRAMIPLGSCTMKLNATAEMMPISWPEFAALHPYAPLTQLDGYRQMIADIERYLCVMTGYSSISLQPNAGSQGEFAGLSAIRAYHEKRGEGHRDICLIPVSAHGTNPASAQMCGMKVITVTCDRDGNVDIEDLEVKAGRYSRNLAVAMLTYPSTHGVFEERIRQLCDIVHSHGGLVYIDGANLNAMVGLCCPGEFGGDVSHLNLHKTFCIPHGGGGPGVGPVAVGQHLGEFLPASGADAFTAYQDRCRVGPVSAALWGSAGILPITWMYIRMMGAEGLKKATQTAILHANYVAHRLGSHYSIVYKGKNGRVAHECIIDMREFRKTAGVSAEDVAKRLVDHGFHAPTMSFPIADTLMIEPTESESKWEIDRFCDAMIAIREEIAAIEDGSLDREDNPLVNAPHTIADIMNEDWKHGYSRQQACCMDGKRNKYWAPVNRVDNVYGDRNLVCRAR